MTKGNPWLRGLLDGISAANLIRSSAIAHKNRIAIIVLDSTLEIAFKNYIENVLGIRNIPKPKWESREEINKIIKKKTDFEPEVWKQVDYFYEIRNSFYHEDSDKTVIDDTVANFQELVEFFINNLFNIQCSQELPLLQSLLPIEFQQQKVPINRISEAINVIVVAVAESESKDSIAINEYLKKKGFKGNIPNGIISKYLNHYYPHFFYKDANGVWKLSEEGVTRYGEIKNTYQIEDKKEDQK